MRIGSILSAALACLLYGAAAFAQPAQDTLGVTTGTNKLLGTETHNNPSATPVSEEVNVEGYSSVTAKLESQTTAGASATAIFAASQPCMSIVLKADISNPSTAPIWIKRESRCDSTGSVTGNRGLVCHQDSDCDTGSGHCKGAEAATKRCVGGSTPGATCTDNTGCTGAGGGTCIGSFPLYAGEWIQLAAPFNQSTNNRDCGTVTYIQGTGCSGSCLLNYAVQ